MILENYWQNLEFELKKVLFIIWCTVECKGEALNLILTLAPLCDFQLLCAIMRHHPGHYLATLALLDSVKVAL